MIYIFLVSMKFRQQIRGLEVHCSSLSTIRTQFDVIKCHPYELRRAFLCSLPFLRTFLIDNFLDLCYHNFAMLWLGCMSRLDIQKASYTADCCKITRRYRSVSSGPNLLLNIGIGLELAYLCWQLDCIFCNV